MNNDTQKKMAAILAAQQAKVNNIKPLNIVKIEPSKMQYFKILWHEGTGKYDETVFDTWQAANNAMTEIYNEHSGLGYLKVKITVKWENGKEFTDRADCSNSSGDFCPNRETIGEYLKRQTGVMYESNLQQGERQLLSFEDTPENNIKPLNTPKPTPKPEEPKKVEDTTELSSITISDLLNEVKPVTAPLPVLTLVDYSPKSFAVIGDTKQVKDLLRQLGGAFNYYLTCGAGWIFPKKKAYTVRKALNLI